MGFTWIFFGIYDEQYGSMAMDQREIFTKTGSLLGWDLSNLKMFTIWFNIAIENGNL